MKANEAIKATIQSGNMIATSYLGDLDDAQLMMRPHAKCNHLNWQVGHLIASDHQMVSGVLPDALPPLPEGFADKYTKETAVNNDAGAFCKKDELMELHQKQQAAALKALDGLSEADLEKPSPEAMQGYAPNVAAVFNMLGVHWLMHVGQWVVVRREADKPIVI